MGMHPIAVARDEWFGSEEGARCLKGLPAGEYLRNRLEAAFLAGAKAQAGIATELVTRHVERTMQQLQEE